jgi:hypothetical protein
MEMKIDIIDQDTREVLFEGISKTSAKVYLTQANGLVKMTQDWTGLRKLWVYFPHKEDDASGQDPRLAGARKFWNKWSEDRGYTHSPS